MCVQFFTMWRHVEAFAKINKSLWSLHSIIWVGKQALPNMIFSLYHSKIKHKSTNSDKKRQRVTGSLDFKFSISDFLLMICTGLQFLICLFGLFWNKYNLNKFNTNYSIPFFIKLLQFDIMKYTLHTLLFTWTAGKIPFISSLKLWHIFLELRFRFVFAITSRTRLNISPSNQQC